MVLIVALGTLDSARLRAPAQIQVIIIVLALARGVSGPIRDLDRFTVGLVVFYATSVPYGGERDIFAAATSRTTYTTPLYVQLATAIEVSHGSVGGINPGCTPRTTRAGGINIKFTHIILIVTVATNRL